MDYFGELLELLKLEREEDRRSYEQLTKTTSVYDRRANGLTWYPIAIRGTEMSRGDYLTVEVERTTNQDISHQLRFGASAMLFSNHDPVNNKAEGIVAYQGGNTLKLTLRTDEMPEWARDGKLGIDLLFDDNSYDEMQAALNLAGKRQEKKEDDELTNILTGKKAPIFHKEEQVFTSEHLNSSQAAAINNILAADDLAIVHGPPGTGKTTTLVQAIKALLEKDSRQILVVAPSNTAVDLLSEKLNDEGLNVLRVGNPARVSAKQMALTLDSKMAAHPSMKEVRKLKKQASEYKNLAHKYKRNFGKAEREQRRALFEEAHRIMKDVGNAEQYVIDDLIAKAQVITATLVGSNHYSVKNLRYHTVVIDEAGQALEPASWIPILKAKKLVLAGDHFQLSPTVKSKEAAKKGLGITLLEKAVALHPEAVVLLEEQYRMNEAIMAYPSRAFYMDKLKANHSVAHHLIKEGDSPLLFIDTAGCGFEEKSENTSTSNPEEAAFVISHLQNLLCETQEHDSAPSSLSVAIIAPYKEQIYILGEQVEHATGLQPYRSQISINTVDSFQGQERDVVYISMTRSNSEGAIGFLSDIRRMNVAMTRAKKKLVVVGDSATLSQHPFYADFIAHTQEREAYRSAWEFMDV